jgi:hypothetical protein
MYTLILLLLFQVVTQPEMNCLGFIRELPIPAEVIIAGSSEEGITALASENDLITLNGPGLINLNPGESYKVVRPEGKVRNQVTKDEIGLYYKELGTVRIEAKGTGYATAKVSSSCCHMIKGDLVVPLTTKPGVEFPGKLSNKTTTYPTDGLSGTIILGKDDMQELAAGSVCFIGVGTQQGAKVGDRFTIYRPQQPFNVRDLSVDGEGSGYTYDKLIAGRSDVQMLDMLIERNLPIRVLGDLIILDTGENTSAAKIINSLSEIHLGDLVVRR